MRNLINAKYYIYKNPRGGLLPYDIIYQNSNKEGKKWLECIACSYSGHWTSGGDVTRGYVRRMQRHKLKGDQIPLAVKTLAEWATEPEKVLALDDELVQP